MLKSGFYPVVVCCALFFTGCGKLVSSLGFGEEKDESIKVQAKVRDINEGFSTLTESAHPHFNQGKSSCDAQDAGVNTVMAEIALTDYEDAAFPGDNRGPRLINDMPVAINKCFDPANRFIDWFNDRESSINRPFAMTLTFKKESGGIYAYRDNFFFPIDNGGEFSKMDTEGTFGHLQTGSKDGIDLSTHNYGFTMEFHTFFVYEKDKGQYIAFEGDDDLWAFIDGKRVVDLGGIHAAQRDTVHLDGLGLTDKGKYPLDFFFAERAVASSKLSIVSSVAFTKE
jgi:fibro-slime domain-containing protein